MSSSGFPYDVDPLSTGQYDDAWQTEGWTTQNPTYPDHSVDPVPLDGIAYITVTGSYFTGKGKPLYGQFRFVPMEKMHIHADAHFLFKTEKAYIKHGRLEIKLPVPVRDNEAFRYRVYQSVGPLRREFEISLDWEMGVYDLSAGAAAVEANYYG